jgi:hypothetical protein
LEKDKTFYSPRAESGRPITSWAWQPYETGEALGSWRPGAAGGNGTGSGERRRGELGKVAEEEAGEERSPFWGGGEV